MPRPVCVLASDHAEALEDRGVIPNCQYHEHVTHREADERIAAVRCQASGQMREGHGRYRSVEATDGRRRITLVAHILAYVSMKSRGPQIFRGLKTGFVGAHTLQAVRSELH